MMTWPAQGESYAVAGEDVCGIREDAMYVADEMKDGNIYKPDRNKGSKEARKR